MYFLCFIVIFYPDCFVLQVTVICGPIGDFCKKDITFKLCSLWAAEFLVVPLPLYLTCVPQCPTGAWKAVVSLFNVKWNQLPLSQRLGGERATDAIHNVAIDLRCLNGDCFVPPELPLQDYDVHTMYHGMATRSKSAVEKQALVDLLFESIDYDGVLRLGHEGSVHNGSHWFCIHRVLPGQSSLVPKIAFGIGYHSRDCVVLSRSLRTVLGNDNRRDQLSQTLACLDSIAENALVGALTHIKVSDVFMQTLIDGSSNFDSLLSVETVHDCLEEMDIACHDLDVFNSPRFKKLMDLEGMMKLLDKCKCKRLINPDGLHFAVVSLIDLYSHEFMGQWDKAIHDTDMVIGDAIQATSDAIYKYFMDLFPLLHQIRSSVLDKLNAVPSKSVTLDHVVAKNGYCRQIYYDVIYRAKLTMKDSENTEFNEVKDLLSAKGFDTDVWADNAQLLYQQRAPITNLPYSRRSSMKPPNSPSEAQLPPHTVVRVVKPHKKSSPPGSPSGA